MLRVPGAKAFRRNPLSAWDRKYEGTMGSSDYYYGPLLRADAEEKFRAGLDVSDRVLQRKGTLPLPLTLVIRPAVPMNSAEHRQNVEHTQRIAAQTKSVGLLEYVHSRTPDRATRPGDPGRETPHTLFNCLHRLGEFIFSAGVMHDGKVKLNPESIKSGDISFLPFLPPPVAFNFEVGRQVVGAGAKSLHYELRRLGGSSKVPNSSQCARAILSSGLNTAAGRLGAVEDEDQAFAEAFAKFCLSGKDVYDADVPLTLNGKPLPLDGRFDEYISEVRRIWGLTLMATVESAVKVFGLYVRAYYTNQLPSSDFEKRDIPVERELLSTSELLSNSYAEPLRDDTGQLLSFVKPRRFEDTNYASELYSAASDILDGPKLSFSQEESACITVYEALHSFLDYDQLQALRKSELRGNQPKYRDITPQEGLFLREKYAKPRNTPQSRAKAQRVNAALDLLEVKERPGLYAVFIQPKEE
jgi:hypothetical protein